MNTKRRKEKKRRFMKINKNHSFLIAKVSHKEWIEILESAPAATSSVSCFHITENTLSWWVPIFWRGKVERESQTFTVVSNDPWNKIKNYWTENMWFGGVEFYWTDKLRMGFIGISWSLRWSDVPKSNISIFMTCQ